MVFVTADLHGDQFRLGRLIAEMRLYPANEVKTLLVCGDFGFLMTGEKRELNFLVKDIAPLAKEGIDIAFLSGNHEHHPMLSKMKQEPWKGGFVHQLTENVVHLINGETYCIDGKTFWVFGGGASVDRQYRLQNGLPWWPEELPTQEEFAHGLDKLAACQFKVDYILTHTAPRSIAQKLEKLVYMEEHPLQSYLETVSRETAYQQWFFGHFHRRWREERFCCLYQNLCSIS